jgi:hypothetical protein
MRGLPLYWLRKYRHSVFFLHSECENMMAQNIVTNLNQKQLKIYSETQNFFEIFSKICTRLGNFSF